MYTCRGLQGKIILASNLLLFCRNIFRPVIDVHRRETTETREKMFSLKVKWEGLNTSGGSKN